MTLGLDDVCVYCLQLELFCFLCHCLFLMACMLLGLYFDFVEPWLLASLYLSKKKLCNLK